MTAALMTAGVTFALTLYACTTKTDFTICGGLFFILAMVALLITISSWIFTFGAWYHPFISGLFCVIYGLYLIFDTQLIVG